MVLKHLLDGVYIYPTFEYKNEFENMRMRRKQYI